MAFRPVLDRHAEEAAALWPRRERAAGAAEVGLDDLAHLDRRVEAHLDGLRLAGREGSKAAMAVDLDGPGATFAQAAQALDQKDAKGLATLLDGLQADQDRAPGLFGALSWVPLERSEWAVRAMLHERCPPLLQRFGLAAHVSQRSDPGLCLIDAMAATASPLRATALEGAGLLGRVELLPDVVADLDHASTPCRLAARLAAALLGEASAIPLLWDQVSLATVAGRSALVVAVAKSPLDAAAKALDAWRFDTKRKREAIVGLAVLGDAQRIPWLLEDMQSPSLARLAGHAFSRITGVAIEGALRAAPNPEGPSGPTDDPAEEDVEPDPDAALPWPDVGAVERAWGDLRKRLPMAQRLLFGAPLDPGRCDRLLREGSQELRSTLAIERALMTPGRPVAAVRAPGFRQVGQLGGAA